MIDGLEQLKEFEPEEREDELPEEVTVQQLERISLSGSDWTTETILNQLEKGNIDLNPRFQRRDAWSRERKSRFIESLTLNFPVPQIVLAERRESRGRYIVLDGKQRLTAILQFAGKGAEGDALNGFTLSNLEVLKHLERHSYSDLLNDDSLTDELAALQNQTMRTVVIRNWSSDALLHMIFVRLNTSSVPLSPQELRQALYPGEFADYIDDRSVSSGPLKQLMGLKQPDFRMRDVEIMLRHLGFNFYLDQYSGNMSAFLNNTTQSLNGRFATTKGEIEQAVDDFDAALETAISVFGEDSVARKWAGGKYESRWNRAILDVLLFYFSDSKVRRAGLSNPEKVVAAYKEMFEKDSRFREAVEATTKSLSATHNRLSIWGNALSQSLSMPLPVPQWDEKRKRIIPSAGVI